MTWIFLAQLTSNDTTFIGVATTIVGALTGAVVHLYFQNSTIRKDLTETVAKELVECKDDRDELRKLYWQLQSQVNHIGHAAREEKR
jgi:uncharacterized membrane protein